MANYYVQNGRYFGEDTSFYEFDEDCLKRSEKNPDFGEDCLDNSEEEPNYGEDRTNRRGKNPNPDEDCLQKEENRPDYDDDCLKAEKNRPDYDNCPKTEKNRPDYDDCLKTEKNRPDYDDCLKAEKNRPDYDNNCLKKKEIEPDFTCGTCSPDADSSENHPDPPADFDRLFTTRRLDMLKTAIPFLPARQQKTFACAVKLVEFRNLVGYFGQNQQTLLGACSDEDPQMRLADMLNALRGYCSPAEQEQIDFLFQVLMTVQMMRESM